MWMSVVDDFEVILHHHGPRLPLDPRMERRLAALITVTSPSLDERVVHRLAIVRLQLRIVRWLRQELEADRSARREAKQIRQHMANRSQDTQRQQNGDSYFFSYFPLLTGSVEIHRRKCFYCV